MAKRFTDTGLNRQPWYRKLKPKLKCAIRFLFDECDQAGVWNIDMETLAYFVGEEVTMEELFAGVNSDKENRIELLGKDKIFIPGFISFQCGELTEKCKPHRPIISLLQKHGLYERYLKGYLKGIERVEEKEQEKEKEKEKEEGGVEETNFYPQGIVPEMVQLFKADNPEYFVDQQEDFPATRQIAEKLKKWMGLSGLFTDNSNQEKIKTRWGEIISFVNADQHYRGYSLSRVNKHFQSITKGWMESNKVPKINGSKPHIPSKEELRLKYEQSLKG